jgi:hypothetical protein
MVSAGHLFIWMVHESKMRVTIRTPPPHPSTKDSIPVTKCSGKSPREYPDYGLGKFLPIYPI